MFPRPGYSLTARHVAQVRLGEVHLISVCQALELFKHLSQGGVKTILEQTILDQISFSGSGALVTAMHTLLAVWGPAPPCCTRRGTSIKVRS